MIIDMDVYQRSLESSINIDISERYLSIFTDMTMILDEYHPKKFPDEVMCNLAY